MTAEVSDAQLVGLTLDELEACIGHSAAEGEAEAAYGFLLLLATQDPERADRIRGELKVALAVARGGDS